MKSDKRPGHFYEGELLLYHETGMEGIEFALHDSRGVKIKRDFNNESGKWDGPERQFNSIEWTHFISDGDHIKVFEKDGSVAFEGRLTRDREKMAKARPYRIFFAPREIELKEWARYFNENLKAQIWSERPVLAEEKK